MQVKPGSEIKIIAIILSVLLIVSVSGIFAYRGLKEIIGDVSRSAKPESKLVLLKQVLSDVSDAESGVKSYNLTHDPNYLSSFYRSAFTIDKNMEELNELFSDNTAQKNLLGGMSSLIDKKYIVLNQMLNLNKDENITEELTRVSERMEKETKKLQSVPLENSAQLLSENKTAPEKRSLFQRLFGKKKKTGMPVDSFIVAAKTETQTEKTSKVKKIVKNEITKVNSEYVEQLRETRQQEFSLTARNEELMDSLRKLAYALENSERKTMRNNILIASAKADKLNNIVAIFCILAGVLLLVVSYVIIAYARKNRDYTAALNKSKTQAEEIAKAKENFLANMSHEIRTPMNAIAGFTKQVLQSELGATQREQLIIVQKSTEHLLHIVNDVLDHAKIQAGKFSFENIAFKPSEILAEVVKLSAPLLANKMVKLNYHFETKAAEILSGDPARLRQIIINLLSNSIKFTEKGSIDIIIKTQKLDSSEAILHLQVTDTGIGIAENKIKEVFEEFQQADDHIFFKYGGTGLGLAITKKLVELQNGKMSIESKENVFTSVKIQIPYAIAQGNAPSQVKKQAPLNTSLLSNISVLVADDDSYNRRLLNTILNKWNLNVKEVCNGKEALREITEKHYDIILMDARMPEMSGMEATFKIRNLEDPKKAKIPIIALSAVSSPDKIRKCTEAGMNEFLSKPFAEEDLFNRILSLVKRDEAQTFTAILEQQPAGPASKEHFQLDELKNLSNGDEKFLAEMIRIFIQTTREGIEGIEKGFTENNPKAIADYAHKISSPCRHLGASDLLNFLKSIEEKLENNVARLELEQLIKNTKTEAALVIAGLQKKLKD